MQEKQYYANGQEVYQYDGKELTYYYKNGKLKARGPYVDDQMEGEWRFYRESGQLWQIGNFKNHKKHGSWVRFDKNDQVEYNELFTDGKINKVKK
jgi:antitoxin component YwqK of YwqJK toxin-antitoxin module